MLWKNARARGKERKGLVLAMDGRVVSSVHIVLNTSSHGYAAQLFLYIANFILCVCHNSHARVHTVVTKQKVQPEKYTK